jgi:hypothetical protein
MKSDRDILKVYGKPLEILIKILLLEILNISADVIDA